MEIIIKEMSPDGKWGLIYLVGENNDNLKAEITTTDKLEEVIKRLSNGYNSLNRKLITYSEYKQNG